MDDPLEWAEFKALMLLRAKETEETAEPVWCPDDDFVNADCPKKRGG